MRWNLTVEERFWAKVNKDGPTPAHRPDLGPCWLWAAAQNDQGYGQIWVSPKLIYAHAFLIGKAGSGFEWDHLCRVRNCVRPTHLERVTRQINNLRGVGPKTPKISANKAKTACPKGHPYDAANTYFEKDGARKCRACVIERVTAYERRKKAVV